MSPFCESSVPEPETFRPYIAIAQDTYDLTECSQEFEIPGPPPSPRGTTLPVFGINEICPSRSCAMRHVDKRISNERLIQARDSLLDEDFVTGPNCGNRLRDIRAFLSTLIQEKQECDIGLRNEVLYMIYYHTSLRREQNGIAFPSAHSDPAPGEDSVHQAVDCRLKSPLYQVASVSDDDGTVVNISTSTSLRCSDADILLDGVTATSNPSGTSMRLSGAETLLGDFVGNDDKQQKAMEYAASPPLSPKSPVFGISSPRSPVHAILNSPGILRSPSQSSCGSQSRPSVSGRGISSPVLVGSSIDTYTAVSTSEYGPSKTKSWPGRCRANLGCIRPSRESERPETASKEKARSLEEMEKEAGSRWFSSDEEADGDNENDEILPKEIRQASFPGRRKKFRPRLTYGGLFSGS